MAKVFRRRIMGCSCRQQQRERSRQIFQSQLMEIEHVAIPFTPTSKLKNT